MSPPSDDNENLTKDESSAMELPGIDHLEASINPCSLESIQNPIGIGNNDAKVWPVMLGCYELQEDGQTRLGTLDLFAVSTNKPHRWENPLSILSGSSGILDGKWYTPTSDADQWSSYYATAHASGEVQVYLLSTDPSYDDSDSSGNSPFQSNFVAKSDSVESAKGDSGLCLALCWDQRQEENSTSKRIISSYSHGQVAIHELDKNSKSLELQDSWQAHTLFAQHPSEVWSVCFVGHDENMAMSGGDEGHLKVWDIRASFKPTTVIKDFTAGVTVLSPHPRHDHLVAAGSYDEMVSIYDVRNLGKPVKSQESLGGGIWRLKWHPQDDDRLLVGAMHGGCRVMQVNGILDDSGEQNNFAVQGQFTKHKSMAYGADWLYHDCGEEAAALELAASCSFYDRALYMWETKMP